MTTTHLMKRRTFLHGSAALGALGLSGMSLKAGASEIYNTTLNIMSHPGQILPIYTHQAEFLKANHGITMNLLESPDPTSYQDALKDLRSGGGTYDMVMHFPRYNGDLVTSGYLRPIDDLIASHNAGALFDNISDTYRKLYCEWGGNTIAIPVDGDVAMMYFRKDAFESAEVKAKYKSEFGTDLAVPRTWEQFKQVANFFTGWDWAGSGKSGYGFQTSTWDRAFIEQQWAPMMASAGGTWFDENCNPAFNNAAGVRAADDLKSLLSAAPEGSASLSWGQTMETVFAEDVAMVLWYMDLGRLGWAENSWFAASGGPEKMAKFGYGPWPGYEVDGNYRNFNSMFYGRVAGISNFTEKPDACMEVMKTLLTPERRVLSMDDAQSGSDMFLKTDYTTDSFKVLTPSQEFLDAASNVIQNGFPEMNMPGTGEYMDSLQGELHAFINGSGTAQEALDRAADRWQSITDRFGRDTQIEAWAKVRASYVSAGLNISG
ncbi:MAG: extracellular solute-binding protein [Alphaproteobacteria bacterium]|nr:extracellular solute-binding protein [Alphaproteobacteria bacterium]